MARHSFHTTDAAATRSLGAALGRVLKPGTLVLLNGPLGAGKTTLVQGIAAGLGIQTRVHSPTFTLIHEHDLASHQGCLVHMDFYRLADPAEARALGLDDYLAVDDIVVIEWPERAAGALPASSLSVALAFAADEAGEGRCLIFEARGEVATTALAALLASPAVSGALYSPAADAGSAHG